jgi:hypothetical protein
MTFFDHATSAAAQARLDVSAEAAAERDAGVAADTARSLYTAPAAPQDRADTPADTLQARKDSAGSDLYAGTAFKTDLPDDTVPGLDAREARLIAGDLGASADDVRMFRTLAAQHVAEPASDEQRQTWHDVTVREIADRNISTADLNAAKRLVQSDPRLVNFLDRTGLGNEPRTVLRFVELARTARGRR